MDVTFILSALIFTLLAIAVAASIFSSASPTKSSAVDFATSCLGDKEDNAGLDASGAARLDSRRPSVAADGWTELSGSSHDHWEVVRTVLSGESESHHDNDTAEQPETLQPHSTSADSMRCVCPSKSQSCELESPSVSPPSSSCSSSSEWGRRSLIGLSEKELLKCAFSYPQTEGDPGSPGFHGKLRSKHMESMMSKQELEEEQRVQREQLAAIFQLLQDNKETFGAVSEGDLEDQFRLYSN